MSGYPDDQEHDPTRPYLGPLQAFERHIYQRHEVESAFGNSYMDLLAKYKEKCKECDREKRNAVLWEKEQRMSERELNGLRAAAESSTFAFAIIDGDGAVFREDLIARGEEGGGEAAHELHKELKHYLQNTPIYSNIDSISVQVVLSVEGLNRALHASGTLQGPDVGLLARFGRGFCRAQPLFSFVDVGYGKEQADHKVRKIFELMANNIQCRCLILGGLHDNGYATFLESFRNNSKICLLETTPAAADFRKLSFSRINFPTVFRSETLPSRLTLLPGLSLPTLMPISPPIGAGSAFAPSPVGSSASPKPNTPTSLASAVQPKREPESAPNSYAAIGRAGSTPGVIDISIQKKAANSRAYYQLNRADERVDVPLSRPDPSVVRALDEKRQKNGANFCNRYHLTGYCKTVGCAFQHGDRLNQAEQLALKHKTRNLVCGSSHQCRDFSCTQGHHCVSPGACYFGDTCRFAEMHGMDITPTLKVYEDGTREVV
ncbi:hypothetical protein B0T24DRAFT_632366 [Lasiosphaeria ovina]|uniref:C3H1-type domain-containing protein n=1 Tax=Lasiosphaeria ovina TaxID=92902 RepID=A0AAE0N4N9_9PEZI|nr:hypothetical protein B0T24DRAFT_632366 [Lasiosphaeria ovina]